MNEAQKFLLNNECDDLRLKDAQKVENWVYVSDIMELYHQEQVKKLTIPGVSQQRELLEWLSNEDYFNIPKDEISEILEDWETYNSNCG